MSVDIRKQPHPRTPRKIRINPPSPEAQRDTPRPQMNSNGARTSTGSPEATRNSGFVIPIHARDLASAKEASRRMNILADTISPRKLPEDRFNSIVRQLNYASTTNGTNGTHPREEQSVAGASNPSRPANKKHPRKLSVNHSAERMNGFHSDGGG